MDIVKYLLDKIGNHVPYIREKIEAKEAAQSEARRWKKLATMDDLTGLPNRVCFKIYWKELKSNATFCIVDIDFFKKINDTHGHLKGNEILQRVARIIEGNKYCFVSRYGGEEFLICCSAKFTPEQVIKNMDDLRREVEFKMKDVGITVSVGVSLVGKDADKLFEQADKALYYSKRNGRNKVTRYSKAADFSTLHTEDKDGNIKKREKVSYV